MLVTLREYMGTEERDRRVLDLNAAAIPITIGRTDACTYKIGKTLGGLAQGISKIQATILTVDGRLLLQDGGADGVSTNGIYCHAERLTEPISLVPGLELTLFKHGIAKVSLVVASVALVEHGGDTYTGQDLLAVLQEQVHAIGSQIEAMNLQIGLLGEQLAQREALDQHQAERDQHQMERDKYQDERLLQTEKRLNRVLAAVLGAIAVIVLVTGWSGGSSEDKKQWSNTLTSVAIGVAALYFKSKDNPSPSKP